MPKIETGIQAAIREYLQWTGWFVFPNVQSALSYKGISDITAIKQSRVVFIEVKTPHKRSKQSEYQLKFEADIKAHGGEYMVARSVDDVMKLNEVSQ